MKITIFVAQKMNRNKKKKTYEDVIMESKQLLCNDDNNNCIMFFPYQKSYHQNFIADFYYPQYELCNLYIAVSGDLISLKELNITSTETKISLNDIKYNYKQQQQR